MWCTNCQQETPGVSNASGRIVCSRCQRPTKKEKSPHATYICDEGLALDGQVAASTSTATKAPPTRFDDWQVRQRVRSVVRELQRPNPTAAMQSSRVSADRLRFEPPHNLFEQRQSASADGLPSSISPIAAAASSRSGQSEASQLIAWLIVITGVLTLGFGLGLIGWSLSAHETRYWNLAIGFALGGQGVLIFGLVLVISRLWRSSRYAAGKLHDVHTSLGQLQQASEALAATRGGSAPAFYAELVRGASPHVLLANLKGQVDQLSTRVGSF
jgi:hypothetical protein